MVSVDKAVIARLKKDGQNFEILVDCMNAIAFKEGKDTSIKDVLADEKVFSDSAKGLVASENTLKTIFGTSEASEIAKMVIRDGDIQLTSEYRAKIRDQKRKRILTYIQRNGIDPRTNLPHPLQRLELAFEEAKVKIDEYLAEDKQINEIIKKLKPILPISFARKEIGIKVPAEVAGKTYGPILTALNSFGKVLKNEWANDGSWVSVVEIPAGMQNDLFDKLNSLTSGSVETTILKTT
ncbi:ribosome assembly factor SBDS [Candidatus Woesearchaeota archaeon]|nr:ribosome assembly factor SBDS [Candidatus Woesearchaeota archaeon]